MTEVDELLGRVIAALPAGEDRPQQRTMVEAVMDAFRNDANLAVQGPTGVGKSVGYLLPAVVRAAEGHRTVVVTSSKALQDQLGRTDLPFLSGVTGRALRFEVLKGRSNYLCRAAVAETAAQFGRGTEQQSLDLPGIGDRTVDEELSGEVTELLKWAEATTSGEQGDLDVTPSDAAWATVSVGPGECVGPSRCAYADECFSEQARERAGYADIVVVNAHLYAAHIQSGCQLLPEHDQLVIDEAHEFEDAMVGALGVSITGWRLRNLVRIHDRCVAGSPTIGMALGRAADLLDDALADALRAAVDDHGSGRLHGALPEALGAALNDADLAVDAATRSLRDTMKAAGNAEQSVAAHRFERAIRTSETVSEALHLLGATLGPGQVRWIAEGRGGRCSLQLTRIDVADTLRSLAWDRSADDDGPDGDAPTVILCSATLDPATAERLGLDARYLAVDSPFDFRRNTILYVPRLPRPTASEWPGSVAAELTHIIERCKGRTLALFTSHRMLRLTVDAVRRALPAMVVLAQGDAPNPVLQRQFLDDEHASLFATASFWTGISSPGTTCSAVVVDRIPFPVPSDPIVEARCDAVGSERAFAEVSVPAAAVQLAQGVGRLIRTSTDRGVVAVLDPRLAEARYRARILERLPHMKRSRERAELDAFIDSLGLD